LGAAVYVAADAWLTRDEHMERTRRSGHAAAAGQPMSAIPRVADAQPVGSPGTAAVATATGARTTDAQTTDAQTTDAQTTDAQTTDAQTTDAQTTDAPAGGPAGDGVARGEAIVAGIVVDGIPESLALGLTVAAGQPGFALLAAVVVGNLTEAYGAAQPSSPAVGPGGSLSAC
jgi:hypothetical protein